MYSTQCALLISYTGMNINIINIRVHVISNNSILLSVGVSLSGYSTAHMLCGIGASLLLFMHACEKLFVNRVACPNSQNYEKKDYEW